MTAADLRVLPTTRAAALASGAKHYFTGEPCKRGHVEPRHADGNCMACNREKQAARLRDPAFLARHSAWSLARHNRKRSEPGFIDNVRANERVASSSPQRKAAKALTDARKNEAMTEEQRRAKNTRELLRHHSGKGDPVFAGRIKANSRRYRLSNPSKVYARCSEYRAAKRGARPAWLTDEHKAEITAIYAEARAATQRTGVKHVVDHIYPINGVHSCGLHVPWNLQVLTATENAIKGNRIPDEQPYSL